MLQAVCPYWLISSEGFRASAQGATTHRTAAACLNGPRPTASHYRFSGTTVGAISGKARSIVKTACGSSEPVGSLFQNPADRAGRVITVRQVMVQRGETVRLAFRLHVQKLLFFETRLAGRAPVMRGAVHRKAGRQRSVRADDQRVLARAAIPILKLAAHESLHLLQAAYGVHHLVDRKSVV